MLKNPFSSETGQDSDAVSVGFFTTEKFGPVIKLSRSVSRLSIGEAKALVNKLLGFIALAENFGAPQQLLDTMALPLPTICLAEPTPGVFVQRRIVSAAIRFPGHSIDPELAEAYGLPENTPLVVASARHGTAVVGTVVTEIERLRKLAGEPPLGAWVDQGFIDQFDCYWTREEAFIIADRAGQINRTRKNADIEEGSLYSENLY